MLRYQSGLNFARLGALAVFAIASVGCSSSNGGEAGDEDDLTSNTALSRTLKFGGTVYVSASASDSSILAAVKLQTQSAFGALRTANVGVNSRELHDVDTKTFKKSKVTMVDPAKPGGAGTPMLRVTYTYTDKALVPKTMAKRSTISLALLGANYTSQTQRILTECTANDKEANEFEGSIWYVFNPSLSGCKTARLKEQKAIDADRAKLSSKLTQVAKSEVSRLYVPMTARLTGNKTNTGVSYPEYDRLYSGGVVKNKLVIGMVNGLMADWAAGEHHDTIDDEGYEMWFEGLREIFKTRPMKLVKTEPAEDMTTFTVGATKVTGVTFDQLIKWELDQTGWPAGVTSYQQKHDLRVAVGKKVAQHWFTFETPVSVKIGSGSTQAVTIQLNSYFGASEDPTPHKRAIKNSDVFIYNGHSYIGYGPLDPKNFSSHDFPSSYQIMFVNGCVSYNYYEEDYFPLKTGGSANLELVTNGLESWVGGSGGAMGRFVGALIDGKQENYNNILKAAEFKPNELGYSWGQDALRVVDGELDNKYKPTTTPIVVK